MGGLKIQSLKIVDLKSQGSLYMYYIQGTESSLTEILHGERIHVYNVQNTTSLSCYLTLGILVYRPLVLLQDLNSQGINVLFQEHQSI